MITKSNYLLLLASFVIGLILTIFFLGYNNIGLTNTDWFTKRDTLSDFLALKFFLQDEWKFPIGLNSNYGELKNSIVFSGAVPILSFIAKLFKNFLPYNFHYFSLWIIICFSLHIFFSYKIIYSLTRNINFSLISSLFFIFSPILIQKLEIHLSLGAHWLILAYLYLEIESNIKSKIFYKIILITVSSLIHFYFTIMILLMNFIFSFYHYFKNKNFKFFFMEHFLILFILFLTMYIVGYFSIPASDSLGFGYGFYKANILTFLDPASGNDTWSLFLPDIKNAKGEYEGFGYLGLGVILLNILLLFYISRNFSNIIKKNIQYVLIAVIFLLIAFTSSMNIGNISILNLKLPIFLYAPLSIIRASGRFIWPIYYLLIIFSLFAFYKLKIKSRYLLLLFFIQLIDLSPGINNFFNPNFLTSTQKLQDPIWKNISHKYKKIKTTKISNSSNVFSKMSLLMIEQKFQETNMSRLGRYNREQASIFRSKLYLDLIEDKIDPKIIYVIDNLDHLRHLKYIYMDSNHGFFFRDGIWILLPNSKFLMSNKDYANLDNINYLNIQTSKEYNVKANIELGILGIGWSHSNYGRKIRVGGAWTEGYSSSLLFNLENKDLINSITFNFDKFLVAKDKSLDVDIFLNDIFLTKLNFNKTKDLKVILDTKNRKFNNNINIINFKISNPITPISKLESIDGRLLGLLLKSIKLN